MKIGVRIPGAGPNTSPENIITVSTWAEELGYHSVWISDHVALPEANSIKSHYPYDSDHQWRMPADTNWVDPLLVLALAAAAAPSVQLGTSVVVVPLRNPMLLAKQLASLDFLSGGRVIFGAGVGWMKEEFEIVGEPFEKRGARSAEMIELMRKFWSGETVTHHGEFYDVPACRMAPTPIRGSIPIVWGGHSEFALTRVARLGDGWHPTQLSIDELTSKTTQLRELCDKYGRDPDSITVIARPGPVYPINEANQAKHHELGIDHVVVDPPMNDDKLADCRAEMERMARVCNLTSVS